MRARLQIRVRPGTCRGALTLNSAKKFASIGAAARTGHPRRDRRNFAVKLLWSPRWRGKTVASPTVISADAVLRDSKGEQSMAVGRQVKIKAVARRVFTPAELAIERLVGS